jgi:hypothetical protein
MGFSEPTNDYLRTDVGTWAGPVVRAALIRADGPCALASASQVMDIAGSDKPSLLRVVHH